MRRKRTTIGLAVSIAAALAGAGLVAVSANAATGCSVTYAISSSWGGGFGAAVTINNYGDAVSSWKLTWSFGAGQTISQLWNGSYTQSGAQVTVTNASYNGSIPSGGNTSFGFNGAWNGSNPVPTSFALNGVACNGPDSNPPTSSVVTTGGQVTTAGPVTTAPRTTAG